MTVIGNYEVVRQIAEGGFGRTYEARHILLGEKACLKQNINLTAADEALLKNEAKLLWNVYHHSLPAMRDFFKGKDGSCVMAMSFVEGKTLENVIKKHGALHPEEVAWISQRMLNALYYLHSKGIVHCDVKPSNIIVQPKEHNAVLVDYGLASLQPTRRSMAPGYTPVYAAPELMNGSPPVPESDLYSLGLTMLYAFGGDPVAKTVPDHVPKPLREYCTDLIRHDPAQRPNWDKDDLISRLSDIRFAAFGRRHST